MKEFLLIKDASVTKMTSHFSSLVHKRDLWLCGFEEFSYLRKDYAIVVDGELYNEQEVRETLREAQYPPMESLEELFLYAYLHWKQDMMLHLRGAYGFVLLVDDEIIAAKDPLGLTLLYYYDVPTSFAITNSMDLLLRNTPLKPTLTKQGVLDLFAFGPSMPEDRTPLQDVRQIPMGCYITKKEQVSLVSYYKLKAKPHTDSSTKTIEKVHSLVKQSILRQMQGANASFLSGGLDSSIITAICASQNDRWRTYSLSYEGNQEHFKENVYQTSLDDAFIEQMQERYPTNHTLCTITQEELAIRLKDAMIARGFPGMADVDSSLLWLCEQVEAKDQVILSGECSDEFFGGYPWFYRDELKDLSTFPWLRSMKERIALLHPFIKQLGFEEYIQRHYQETLRQVDTLPSDCKEDKRARQHTVLCLHWFMQTLIARQNAMARSAKVAIRAPFADLETLEYVYNIPWNLKFYQGQEKGILRKAFEKELPKDVCWRKKNPFPKTHDPYYAQLVSDLLLHCYEDKASPLHTLFDDQALKELIDTKGESFSSPWYGQLMSGPQLLAYLYQIDCWIRTYHIRIDLHV